MEQIGEIIKSFIEALFEPVLEWMKKADSWAIDVDEKNAEQDAKILNLTERVTALEEGEPIKPPIDPPIDPPSHNWPGIIGNFDTVVFQFDGNNNDDDDIAALPVSALYAKAAGIVGRTKFFFNNSRDEKDVDWQVAAMRNSAAFAKSLGIECFDYAANETGTLNELVSILSSGKKILSLEGGPMGTIYQALGATPVEFHKNITLVSHSQWNENRDNSGENKKWNPMKEKFPQVTYIDITDQNPGFKSDDWTILDSVDSGVLKDAREAMKRAGEKDPTKINDASDSGMFYWALTGNEDGTVSMAISLFEAYLENDFKYGDFYKAEEGVYVSNPVAGSGWESENGYLVFKGDDSFENQKDETTLLFAAELEPGKYQVQIWNKGGDPNDVSKENDSWIRAYPDFYAQKGNGEKVYDTDKNDTSNGFIKFYSNTATWTLQTSAIDNDPHQIFVEIEIKGVYVFRLGGRSNNHSVGRIFLRNVETDPSILDKYTPDYVSGGVIDPPINPDLGEVEIVSNRALIEGSEGFFEAIVSSSLDVEAVEFFLNNERVNIERNYKYESKFTIPKGKFQVAVKVAFKDGAGTITGSKVFTSESGGGTVVTPPSGTASSFTIPPASLFDDARVGATKAWGIEASQFSAGPIFQDDWKRELPQFQDIKFHAQDDMQQAYGDATKDPATGEQCPTWKVNDYIVICDPASPGVDPWNDKLQWKYNPDYNHTVTGNLSLVTREFMLPDSDPIYGAWNSYKHGKMFNGVVLTSGTPQPPGANPFTDDNFEYSSSMYWPGVEENGKGDFYGSVFPDGLNTSDDTVTFWGMAVYGHDTRMGVIGHQYQEEFWYCDLPTNTRHALRRGVWITVEEVCILSNDGRNGTLAARLKYSDETEWRYMRYITDLDMRGNGTSLLRAGGMLFYYGGGPQNLQNRSVRVRSLATYLKNV